MTRRYSMYDPFILSQQATPVYYLRYPGKIRDKIDWAVVVKIKSRVTVEVHNTIEKAHQEDEMVIHGCTPIEEDSLDPLQHENAELEEISQTLGDNIEDDELQQDFLSSTNSDSSESSEQ